MFPLRSLDYPNPTYNVDEVLSVYASMDWPDRSLRVQLRTLAGNLAWSGLLRPRANGIINVSDLKDACVEDVHDALGKSMACALQYVSSATSRPLAGRDVLWTASPGRRALVPPPVRRVKTKSPKQVTILQHGFQAVYNWESPPLASTSEEEDGF